MLRRSLFIVIAASLAFAGCNSPSEASKTEGEQSKTKGSGKPKLQKLIIEDLKKGGPTMFDKNPKPLAKDEVAFLYYTGKFENGEVFDSNDQSRDDRKWPLVVYVGAGRVIRGWEEGIVGMLPGGKRKLSIPWNMAYGEAGRDKIPPKTDLYFEVELIDIMRKGDQDIIDVHDEKVGTGPVIGPKSTVTIRAHIGSIGGKVVEDMFKSGKSETFQMGTKAIHRGTEEGILGMRQGGVRWLKLPPLVGFKFMSREMAAPPDIASIVKVEALKVQ